MAKWFGAHNNEKVRFSSAVKCKKEPQVLTSLLNQRRNYYHYYPHIDTAFRPNIVGPSAGITRFQCLAYRL